MKLRRILAMAGIVLLIGLYVTTLVCAIFQTPFTSKLLKASMYATFVIPVILYAGMLAVKFLSKNKEENEK